MKRLFLLILALLISGISPAQDKTNLEVIKGLIGKSVDALIPAEFKKENKVFLSYSSPESYSFLKNMVIEKGGSSIGFNPQAEGSDYIFSYALEDVKVKYSDCFTKSFLGRNYVEREVVLTGLAGFNPAGGSVSSARFTHSAKDTVEYGGLKELASPAYPFTNPEIPDEPFFSSILEPVIAVGVAVTTIYLLFTVRSK